MHNDTNKLKELAERATPGPWNCNRHWAIVGGPVLEFTNGAAQQQIAMACGQIWMHDEELRNNAEWIAAANPAAVLELIAEVERLRKDAERYRFLCGKERGCVVVRDRTSHLFGESLDAAIDAALEGGGR